MRTVLVADPNATFAAVVSDALQRLNGLNVVVAASGPEALRKAAAAPPDVAVVDGALPECALAELIGALRQSRPDLPVVLMPLDEADLPASVPVQGVLSKPFFLPDLAALITDLLGPEPAAAAAPAPEPQPAGPGGPRGPAVRPRDPRLSVTGPLAATAPLRARLAPNTPAPARPAAAPAASPVPLPDDLRRALESRVEMMSRALRDEPVFIAQGERVLIIVPRLSQSATAALAQVAARAWGRAEPAPEVIRFEGETEINRYMLYSVRVSQTRNLTLSVALRLRIPLPIVRRVTRETALELAKLLTA
ncbi:MAG: response regulator [Anaerolineales bacterium]|nr:response regulator [Anaerolineales bacterium]